MWKGSNFSIFCWKDSLPGSLEINSLLITLLPRKNEKYCHWFLGERLRTLRSPYAHGSSCLSVVCNVVAPYQQVWTFRKYFCADFSLGNRTVCIKIWGENSKGFKLNGRGMKNWRFRPISQFMLKTAQDTAIQWKMKELVCDLSSFPIYNDFEPWPSMTFPLTCKILVHKQVVPLPPTPNIKSSAVFVKVHVTSVRSVLCKQAACKHFVPQTAACTTMAWFKR